MRKRAPSRKTAQRHISITKMSQSSHMMASDYPLRVNTKDFAYEHRKSH
ncbi:hypothetical protein L581_2971 [Serratia fonticola AU-AP2C]|nr:hypothetical protein L581_2971 [Serratia fonticola AU-AP2C]